jgi:hypothetical protein
MLPSPRRAWTTEVGDGWNPFLTSVSGVDLASRRTASFGGQGDLRSATFFIAEGSEKICRTTSLAIVLGGVVDTGESWTPPMLVDRIGRYQELESRPWRYRCPVALATSGATTPHTSPSK